MRDRPPPMTLGNMRQNGVRSVVAMCLAYGCSHKADVLVDQLTDDVFVPDVGRRLRCSVCQGREVQTRPAWHLGARRRGMGEPV